MLIKLDITAKPWGIDLISPKDYEKLNIKKGTIATASFEIDGDKLRICCYLGNILIRPKEIGSSADSGLVLFCFERWKPPPPPPFGREWQTPDGALRAEFVEFGGGNVVLKKKDGSPVNYPSLKLSDADRKWIQAGCWPG